MQRENIMKNKVTLDEVNQWIKTIPLFGKKVGHRNIECILQCLNEIIPIETYLQKTPIIHVTGTNGKGSVCKMLSSIYTEEGILTGLFTSPHIDVVTERVQVNNQNISSALFCEGYEVVHSTCNQLKEDDIDPTFFEWLFAIGLYCFYKSKAELLIIEVGIGGRLDTTNILPQKRLSVVTTIGLDHQELLGHTFAQVASEKAGIIKEKGKVVIGNLPEEGERIIRCIAREKENRIYKVFQNDDKIIDFTDKGIDFSINNKYYYYEKLHLNTCAVYQLENCKTALMCLYALKEELPVMPMSVVRGLEKFYWPGRLEQIYEGIYIDGAHNMLGVSTVLDALSALPYQGQMDLLLGMKKNKDYKEVIKKLVQSNRFRKVYLVDLSGGMGVPKECLYDEVKKYGICGECVEDLNIFLQEQQRKKDGSRLFATGSLFLTSDIRKLYQEDLEK